jgi:hypothetical protein
LQSRLDEFDAAREFAQSPKDRTNLVEWALEDITVVLENTEGLVSDSERNQMLAKVIESVYPNFAGDAFTITLRGFDDHTQLIAEVMETGTPTLCVINKLEGG